MAWRKLGRLFVPAGDIPWMRSHASNPTAEHRGGDVFRIYFGSRDEHNRTHIGWVDADLGDRPKVLRVAAEPAVGPGPRGAFDDSGTSMGCVVPDGDRLLLYYLGWNLGVTVPWRNSIGLAVRETPDGPFVKQSPAPVLDRSAEDPFSLTYPCVLREGAAWRMWYGSHLTWGDPDEDMVHVVKYAESADGRVWHRDGLTLLAPGPGETAANRPWVVRDADCYRMWVSLRGASYRVGYAESADGRAWEWRGPSGLDPSADGWDGEMVCYPSVVRHHGRLLAFYNGNRFGRTGFGVAVEDA